MSARAPEYTPMCNRHLRFYLSDPNRTEFQDYIAEKQFRAVEKVLADFSPEERSRLKEVMVCPGRSRDLTDSYIRPRLSELGYTSAEANDFYALLTRINKKIAISLGYIAGRRPPIHWTENF